MPKGPRKTEPLALPPALVRLAAVLADIARSKESAPAGAGPGRGGDNGGDTDCERSGREGG